MDDCFYIHHTLNTIFSNIFTKVLIHLNCLRQKKGYLNVSWGFSTENDEINEGRYYYNNFSKSVPKPAIVAP
jgi:hypothetical protein